MDSVGQIAATDNIGVQPTAAPIAAEPVPAQEPAVAPPEFIAAATNGTSGAEQYSSAPAVSNMPTADQNFQQVPSSVEMGAASTMTQPATDVPIAPVAPVITNDQLVNDANNLAPVPLIVEPIPANISNDQANQPVVNIPAESFNQATLNIPASSPSLPLNNMANPSVAAESTAAAPVTPTSTPMPEPELKLGTIAGQVAAGIDLTGQSVERVPGIISGNDMKVVQQMTPLNQVAPAGNGESETVSEKHPLYDLYVDLQKQAENSQLRLDQEMEADRQNKNIAVMKDEALGWQITSKVTNVLMVVSWILSAISLFFPLIFKNLAKDNQGFSADLIFFIVTIMILLTCTILSFWIRSHPILKIITWCIFVFFVVIFIVISLHSGGIIKENLPFMSGFFDRFSF